MKVSCRQPRLLVIAVAAAVMMAGCPLPYEYNGKGAGTSHTSDPSSPNITAPVIVSYSVQGGTSGTVGDGSSFYSGQTTTVTLSTATVNSVIFYTDNGTPLTLTSLNSAKKITGSSGDMTISRTTSLQSLDIRAIAIGPNMLPSPSVHATVGVSPYPILSVTRDKASVSEDGGTATFTITSSSPPTGDITVHLLTGGNYVPADLTGPLPASGTSFTATLIHSTTTISLPITGVHDAANVDHTVTLTIQADPNSPPAYTVGAPASASVVLQDDGTYTVTYNGNGFTGGSAPTDSNNYPQGATVTVQGNTGSLVKTGFAFTSWNTQANGSGTTYLGGATFPMGSSNVTLYAVWTPTYTMIYNGNGATGGSAPTDSNNYMQGATAIMLGNTGNLVQTGFAFAGWNTQAGGGGTSYAAGATFTMGAANAILYAVWIPSNLTFTSSGTSITIIGFTTAPSGSLTIPGGVTSISTSAFQSCSGLTNVTFPSSLTSIGVNAFCNSGLTSVTIPATVLNISNNAFGSCTSLTSISVDTGSTNYKSVSGVLYNKAGTILMQAPGKLSGAFTIPSGVNSIAYAAFNCCFYLTSVTIPSSVTSIGQWAFELCGLTSLTIPSSVTSIATGAFMQCISLPSISVDTANPNYESISGVMYNKAGTTLLQAPAGITGVFTIPSSVTSIGAYAFIQCSSLTSVTIPSSVTSIGSCAFQSCSGLTSITIPSSVTSIGSAAFNGCINLSNVYVLETTPPALPSGSYAFTACAAGLQIHVPSSGLVATYKTAAGWSDYASMIVYP